MLTSKTWIRLPSPIAGTMDKTSIRHLAIFIVVLLLLNMFFHLHISIIGSLLLTIGLSFAFNYFDRRS